MSAHVPPGSTELTARQAEVLAIIEAAILKNGFSPSVREIMTAAGVGSPNGIMCHIESLHRKGYITYQPNTARSIRILGARPTETLGAMTERIKAELPAGASISVSFVRGGVIVSYEHDGLESEPVECSTGLDDQINHALEQISMIEAARQQRGPKGGGRR